MINFESARQSMVDGQVRVNDVNNPALIHAMRCLPREKFAPKSKSASVYSEVNTEIASGRWLINPRDFAKIIQALEIQAGDVVLDIGCGRGYSTAVLSYIAETVVGVEEDRKLVKLATENLEALNINHAVVVQSCLADGAKKHGPYDIIFVNAAVSFIPNTWFEQLEEKGRLGVVWVKKGCGEARVYKKTGGKISYRVLFETKLPVLPGFEEKKHFSF